jgi:hypothetical protein
MADTHHSTDAAASFLSIPEELRILIYTHLFTSDKPIKIEPDNSFTFVEYAFRAPPSESRGFSTCVFRVPAHIHPLSSQILSTSKQIHHEALDLLYSLNAFDCTTRDGIKLLLSSIPPRNFANITSLVIDWDQLLDFSFQLAKPDFVSLTSNLTSLTMAHWRTRVLGGSSMLWRDVKAYERTLMQAAIAVTQKSANLNCVAQHHWVSKYAQPEVSPTPLGVIGNKGPSTRQASSTQRIKWRFLCNENQLWRKLATMTTKGTDAEENRSVQSALDPF